MNRYMKSRIVCSFLALSLLNISSPATAGTRGSQETITDGTIGMCDSGAGVNDYCFVSWQKQLLNDTNWQEETDPTEIARQTGSWRKVHNTIQYWPDNSPCSDLDTMNVSFGLFSSIARDVTSYKVVLKMSDVDFENFTFAGAFATFVSPGVVEVEMPVITTHFPNPAMPGDTSGLRFARVLADNELSHCWNNGTKGMQYITNAQTALPLPLVHGVGAKESTGYPGDTRIPSKNKYTGIAFNLSAPHFNDDGTVFDDGFVKLRLTARGLQSAGTTPQEVINRGIAAWVEETGIYSSYIPNYSYSLLPNGGIEIVVTGIHFSRPKLHIQANHLGKKQSLKVSTKPLKKKKKRALPSKTKQGQKILWVSTSPNICQISGSKTKPKVVAINTGICTVTAKNGGTRKYMNLNKSYSLKIT